MTEERLRSEDPPGERARPRARRARTGRPRPARHGLLATAAVAALALAAPHAWADRPAPGPRASRPAPGPSLAGAAAASSPTRAFASAGLGKLTVTAGVVLSIGGVRFLGAWSSPAASCGAARRVVVEATLSYTPALPASGPPRLLRFHRAGDVDNCAQSGRGITVGYLARRGSLACPDGRWRPGIYGLSATAIVGEANGAPSDATLHAVAELGTAQDAPCR